MRNILQQSFRALEIILVENGSTDNSLELCNALAAKDSRIFVIHSQERGTSLARKKGVQYARGRYIVFSDQDDTYINFQSIQKMYDAILSDGVQICQFCYYKSYVLGLKRKVKQTVETHIIERDSIYADAVKGIAGVSGSKFDTMVWNKIYEAKVLKSAVNNIHEALFYAEDEYLNLWSFFDKNVHRVSVHDDAYYIWNVGSGFSSSKKAAGALFRDYEIVKPTALRLLSENNCLPETCFAIHLESIYFYKSVIEGMIAEKESQAVILEKIREMDAFAFIFQAKCFFRAQPKALRWEELDFLISEYTPIEYFEWCMSRRKISARSVVQKFLSRIK